MADNAFLEIVKLLLKPGYLYGIGEDGELYSIPVDKLPREGESVSLVYFNREVQDGAET